MNGLISVIIPVYNGEKTIRKCLEAIFQSDHNNYEVIVVDDHSQDASRQFIERFPCKLVTLSKQSGAAQARNAGANVSNGSILFFTDADCLLEPDTLKKLANSFNSADPYTIVGGTYTVHPYDRNFYGKFQSIFVNYFESKHADNPDYIATHAMAIGSEVFFANRGFNNDKYPILEDVEYSHRLRSNGIKLKIDKTILVKHIFGFSIIGSILNAIKKSQYWAMYLLDTNSLLEDSGTASYELKINVLLCFVNLVYFALFFYTSNIAFLGPILLNLAIVIYFNMGFIKATINHFGWLFCCQAMTYYLLFYPLAVGLGSGIGVGRHVIGKLQFNRTQTCSHP